MKIIHDVWFNNMLGVVGIVVGEDEITGERKAYVGVAAGHNLEDDMKLVAELGGKFPLVRAEEIRDLLAMPRKKTTGMPKIECAHCGGHHFLIRGFTRVHVDFDSEDVNLEQAGQGEAEVFCHSCGRKVSAEDSREIRKVAPGLGKWSLPPPDWLRDFFTYLRDEAKSLGIGDVGEPEKVEDWEPYQDPHFAAHAVSMLLASQKQDLDELSYRHDIAQATLEERAEK